MFFKYIIFWSLIHWFLIWCHVSASVTFHLWCLLDKLSTFRFKRPWFRMLFSNFISKTIFSVHIIHLCYRSLLTPNSLNLNIIYLFLLKIALCFILLVNFIYTVFIHVFVVYILTFSLLPFVVCLLLLIHYIYCLLFLSKLK